MTIETSSANNNNKINNYQITIIMMMKQALHKVTINAMYVEIPITCYLLVHKGIQSHKENGIPIDTCRIYKTITTIIIQIWMMIFQLSLLTVTGVAMTTTTTTPIIITTITITMALLVGVDSNINNNKQQQLQW